MTNEKGIFTTHSRVEKDFFIEKKTNSKKPTHLSYKKQDNAPAYTGIRRPLL